MVLISAVVLCLRLEGISGIRIQNTSEFNIFQKYRMESDRTKIKKTQNANKYYKQQLIS